MSTPADRGPRLLALFDELVDLEPAQRGARLAALRGDDAALATPLARMLAADGDGGVLDGPMADVAATVYGQLGSLPATDGAPGRRVGPFVLERLLGRGGMGEVWLAQRSDGDFRQQVALKLLKRGMDSDDLRRRFVQERRILADLSHPGIARFTDGGVGDDGAPWYAMEYVAGVPLTAYAAAQDLDVRARVALMLQVVDAVAYAQTRLVVHRDLKPSNILVDADGRVRLLDFGIAKLLDATVDAGATATGLRAMSPAYAAPEQILDESISTATDVYSLGVVLYELLTGVLPHQRATATLESLADRVRSESTQRPSAALRRGDPSARAAATDPARQAREIAGDLDTLVLTALRRESARRYASAAAMADDLRRWLDGRPIAARADSAGYRLRKFAGRHRLAVASAIAVALALVGGTGVALWQAGVAREQAARAAEQAHRATTIKRFFSRMFQDSAPTAQRRGAQFTAREWVEQASARVAVELADAPDAQAEIRVALATALLGFDARREARALLDAAIPQLRASAATDPAPLVAGLQYLAIAQRGDGEFEAARATVDEALVLNERVADREARLESALELRTQLLTQANAQRNYAAALEIGRAILHDRSEQLGADHPRLAVDWNNLGQTHNMLEQPVEATRALERALALLRADPESPESRQAFVLAGLCQAALGQGQLASALERAVRAREVAARTLGPAHVLVHRADSCAMVALRHLGRFDEARATAERMLATATGVDAEARGLALMTLGATWIAQGDAVAAAAALAEARAAFDDGKSRNAYGPVQAASLHGLALALHGDCAGALRASESALSRLADPALQVGYRVADARIVAADALALCGQAQRAEALRVEGRARWADAWRAGDTPVPAPLRTPTASGGTAA
jgi:serine/threonine-protein kinase